MKSKLLLAAIVLSLAACTQPASDIAATPDAPAAVADAPAKGDKPVCPEGTGYQVLPKGVKLTIDYHLRSDRIYTHKSGKSRRKVVLEVLSGDATGALAELETSMAKAGFTASPRKTGDNGRTTISYTKKGVGVVTVSSSNDVGDKPSNPGAKGTLMIDAPFKA
jgi:hypothetical protein